MHKILIKLVDEPFSEVHSYKIHSCKKYSVSLDISVIKSAKFRHYAEELISLIRCGCSCAC